MFQIAVNFGLAQSLKRSHWVGESDTRIVGLSRFEKDPRRPARVDNACKDILDGLVLKIQNAQNGKLVVVGYADQSEVKSPSLAAQRAANVVYYLTNDSSPTVDASRMEAHQGGVRGKSTHFYFVQEGKLCEGQVDLGTAIDTSKVKGQTRKVPGKKKAEHEQ